MRKNIDVNQAYEWLQRGDAVLVDVREADEFKAGHIAYALSLPLGGVAHLKLPHARKVIFACQSGVRGERACAMATDCGGDVYNIEGGFNAWKAAGYPVVMGQSGGVTLFRQVQMIVGSLVLGFVVLGFIGFIWAFALAGLFGAALLFAGVTGWCGLALLLAKMPWNK